ncbi:MAG: hypothetical protein QM703_18595 [Gemmatales bacterium]
MSTITIPVPDDLLLRLRSRAEAEQKTIETVASEQLQKAMPARKSSFLEKCAGSIHSGITDWGTNHDEYIGQSIMNEIHRKTDDAK